MISNPDAAGAVTSEELAELTRRYPYFSAAHQLLTKVYQHRGDHRFSDQLHHAAVYSSDRRRLYEYLRNQAVQPTAPAPVAEAVVAQPVVEPAPAANEQTTRQDSGNLQELAGLILSDEEQTPVTENPVAAPTAPHIPTAMVTPVAEPVVEQEAAPEPAPQTPDEDETNPGVETPAANTKPEISPSEIDPMDREILLEAMQSSIELEVTPEHDTEADTDASGDGSSYAAWIYRRSQRLHFGEDRSKSAEESPSEEVPSAAGDWLRKATPSEEEAHSDTTEDLPAFSNQPLSHGVRKISVPDEKSHQRDLIDRFIRLEPNISRGKAAEYSTGNIARESLEEDLSLVTETIAQLYARQGKLDKARKAFKKLIELYPEKSIYFAAQLKNLDKLKK
jgi:tetratricopeptide (TPR) repeat protein